MARFTPTVVMLVLILRDAVAHPGIGIVEDSRGNIFFTDLQQVWKISLDGKKAVAVPGIHTHELYVDADDSLYGEHLWYEGDETKKWGHRIWRLTAGGTLSEVVPKREGLLEDDGFVRDASGVRYFSPPSEKTVIRRRSPEGRIETHATGLRDPQWMTVTPEGTLYLIDTGDLVRVSPQGKMSALVRKLSSQNPAPAGVTARHYHMGLWTDKAENVYVAIPPEKVVLKVTPDGTSSIVARGEGPWSITSGTFDRSANLWLLEYSPTNAARVRRVGTDGAERVF